jgi:hypothetical protein
MMPFTGAACGLINGWVLQKDDRYTPLSTGATNQAARFLEKTYV